MRTWLLLALLAIPAAAQDATPAGPVKPNPKAPKPKAPKPKEDPKTPKVDPTAGKKTIDPNKPAKRVAQRIVHRVTLKSGTVLVGTIAPAMWEITTNFGKLRVPIGDIARVDFGRAADPELSINITRWIGMLANPDPAHRKRAMRMLRSEAVFAYPVIEQASKSHGDPEVKRACETLLESLDIDEDDVMDEHDVIVTQSFTFRGSIEPQSFQVRVDELGGLNVRRRDIRTIIATEVVASQTNRIEVTGDHNHRGWLETKIKLKKGQRFRVRASGSIHFTQYGNRGICSPQFGAPQMGSTHNYPVGVLLGRIENGAWFPIGQDYKGKASASGVLKLAVNHSYHRNMQHTGSYKIVVTLR